MSESWSERGCEREHSLREDERWRERERKREKEKESE